MTGSSSVQVQDHELEKVRKFMARLDGTEVGAVLRAVLDAAINSAVTGRFMVDSLQQSEKTAIGTQVEIALRNLLKVKEGAVLDLLVEGVEVDVKWSTGKVKGPGTSWMIPTEAFGRIVCLVTAWDTDKGSYFSLGLLRTKSDASNLSAPNKDKKRGVVKRTREDETIWLFRKHPMPANALLSMKPEEREKVLAEPAGGRRMAEALKISRSLSTAQLKLLDVPNPLGRMLEVADLLKQSGFTLMLQDGATWITNEEEAG